MDVSLYSLKVSYEAMESCARELRLSLVALESKLRIAHAARFLSQELLEVFLHEIHSAQRLLKRYAEPVVGNPLFALDLNDEVRGKPAKKVFRENESAETQPISRVARRERVLSILKDKGEATIKDIIEVVTDCSEKTIQRELTALIKDNIVHREGERRWSKYKLV
jgi:DNA-binding transcriptional ArsR family regulator